MRSLPANLQLKADKVLWAYGGLKGLASKPVWLVNLVLRSFFTENEMKQIQAYLRIT